MSNDYVDVVRFVAGAGGTVDFQFSATVQGYQSPVALCVNTATYEYRAESADLSQWENGFGVFTSATNSFARTTISASSNGNAKVNFSTAPQVGLTIAASSLKSVIRVDQAQSFASSQQKQAQSNLGIANIRTPSTSPITITVSPTGNDANVGSVAQPVLTIGRAVALLNGYDTQGAARQISIIDGTYDITSAIGIFGENSLFASHVLFITGNASTPANVLIRANTNNQNIFDVEDYGGVVISGVKLVANTGVTGVIGFYVRQHTICDLLNIDFGAMPSGGHILVDSHGSCNCTGNYTISGGAGYHAYVRESTGCLHLNSGFTTTLTGTPAFTSFFIGTGVGGSIINPPPTYSGSASGTKFNWAANTKLAGGADVTTYPGTVAGVDARYLGKCKIVGFTRSMTAANGTQSVTGVGFKPKEIVFMATDQALGTGSTHTALSFVDNAFNVAQLVSVSNPMALLTRNSDAILLGDGTNVQIGAVSSYDSDGFTLTWTKSGTPAATTAQIFAVCRG